MIKKSLFIVATLVTAIVLIFYSRIKKDQSLAIVAEVEPQKTAISFHKSIRVKTVHVQPGQHVKAGDLLLTVERPDLLLDIQKAQNDLAQIKTEKGKIKSRYQTDVDILRNKYRLDIASIDKEIELLLEEDRSDSTIYSQLTNDTPNKAEASEIKISAFLAQKALEESKLINELNQRKQLSDRDLESLELQVSRLESEMATLRAEEEALKQYAPFNGTIGTVSVQLMELVPPFETIISIYEEHPRLIKAYLNEKSTLSAQVGDTVTVSSINRTYAIPGSVVEIGSRIVSYPKQMNPFGQQQMWGREVFVQIADKHKFLSGEKVYVRLRRD